MDTTKKSQAVLSLCSGYGGIERGINLAGVEHRVVTYVEIEAYAIANLVSKMESGQLDAAPVWTNLKTLPVEPFRRRVDIITGGYPCSPFSVAGKRGAEKDERHLWPYIREIIRAVRPVRCFFENVEGHINLGLREVISDLESLGYKTAWGIFSAAEVGAPHQRKRVFIMADSQSEFRERSKPKRIVGRKSKEKVRNRSSVVSDVNPERQQEQNYWQAVPESRILRVVDGCPDRVDRIRLAGNGVVPQTAAKAWAVLSRELSGEKTNPPVSKVKVSLPENLWLTPTAMDYLPVRSDEALMRQATTTRKGRKTPASLREQVHTHCQKIYDEARKKGK